MTQQSNTRQRAARLPAHVPGQVVTIPLDLLPIYLSVNRLEVMDRSEVQDREQRTGQRKAPGALWVKRQGHGEE